MSGTLAFAFAAGALSTVNPCGFAVLPGFLAYYLGHETGAAPAALTTRLSRGVTVGASLSAGYTGVFAIAGLLVAAGLRLLVGAMPWVAVAVGIGLVAAGVLMLAGRTFGLRVDGSRLHGGDGAGEGVRGVVTFGAAYAVASLSCSLAVLLAVIGQALATADLLAVIGVFAAYGAGAASVLVLLAVSVSLASGALARAIRRTLPFVGRVSGAVLVLSGAYLVAYWAPVIAGDGDGTALSRAGGAVAGTVAGWLEGRVWTVALVAAAVLTCVAALVTARMVRRRRAYAP